MIPATSFYGITCCVTHFNVPNISDQVKSERSKVKAFVHLHFSLLSFHLLLIVQNAQVSDTTGDAKSTSARFIKIPLILPQK